MANLNAISRLYENVLYHDLRKKKISKSDIRAGIQRMGHVYAPSTSNFNSDDTQIANFNDPACRCAYLHKYAPLHTLIVLDAMVKTLQFEPGFARFRDLLVNFDQFKICSLGGGPGSDVIGVLTALSRTFGPFNSSVTIVDCMEKWSETFSSILHEISVKSNDHVWSNVWNYNSSQWNYIGCNLLSSMTDEVNKSIASASLITMVKFVSAAICAKTEEMVNKIFRVVKPGALVLFIDNAAGGFTQIVERASKRNGLEPIFGPLKHEEYEVEALKIERFGYTSCFKTRVTIILLQKIQNHQQTRRNLNSYPSVTDQNNAITPKPVACLDFVVLNENSSKIKTANAINPPRPQGVINQPFAVVMPQKPGANPAVQKPGANPAVQKPGANPAVQKPGANPAVQKPGANPAVQQNRIVVNNKRKANSAHSPERPAPNGKDLTANKNNTAPGLQRPNASIGRNAWNVPNTTPGSRSPVANPLSAPLLDTSRSFPRSNSGLPSQQKRPNVIVQPPKSPTRSTSTARLPQPVSSAVRTYRPVPVDRRERDQALSDSEADSEEGCCTCCTVS